MRPLRLAVATVVIAAAALVSMPAAEAAVTVVATPSTGLTDGDTVQFTVSNAVPGGDYGYCQAVRLTGPASTSWCGSAIEIEKKPGLTRLPGSSIWTQNTPPGAVVAMTVPAPGVTV